MSESEQNKTEEPTPFKLKKAREKGNIPKGTDLAFLGTLIGLAFFVIALGPKYMQLLREIMRMSLLTLIQDASTPQQAPAAVSLVYMPAVTMVLLLGACVFVIILFVQLLQTRGLMFTTHPLKPDFNRINPGKGLKRIFSMKTLKDAGKNILKMSIFLAATYMLIMHSLKQYSSAMTDAESIIGTMYSSALRLLFLYMVLAFFFAIIDQVIVRKEFTKQMRMSTSEVKRETKDREGEPRLKQKRKQLHAEFVKQTNSAGNLPGSDMLVVNPQHYAVALAYDAETMQAPTVTTKGRNRFALELRTKAFHLGIPIIENPPLARKLFRSTDAGKEISEDAYQGIADAYLKLHRLKQNRRNNHDKKPTR